MKRRKAFLLLTAMFLVLLCVCGCMKEPKNTGDGLYTTSSDSGYDCERYTGEVDKSRGFWEDHSVGEPWIDSSNSRYLEEGFEDFYDETGVWPFLYIVDEYGAKGSSGTYEEKVYDELFGNCPGNLLFVFIGNEESYYIAAGNGNSDVVNTQTIEVFSEKINKYWSSGSTDGDLAKIFGSALKETGTQLMKNSENTVAAKENHWSLFRTVTIIMIVLFSLLLLAVVIVNIIDLISGKKSELKTISYNTGSYGQMNGIYCHRCGTPVFGGGMFCSNCGNNLVDTKPRNNRSKTMTIITMVAWALLIFTCFFPFYGIRGLSGLSIRGTYSLFDLTKEIDAGALFILFLILPLGGILCLFRPGIVNAILQVALAFSPALYIWVGLWGNETVFNSSSVAIDGSLMIGAYLLFVLWGALLILSVILLITECKMRKQEKNVSMNYGGGPYGI